MNKRNRSSGLVYSTNPDAMQEDEDDIFTPIPEEQRLKVKLENKHRGGKTVVLISGFKGRKEDGEALCKLLKNKCGTGGSYKDGEIIIQGNNKSKIEDVLHSAGYKI